jgi:hypothetical protein
MRSRTNGDCHLLVDERGKAVLRDAGLLGEVVQIRWLLSVKDSNKKAEACEISLFDRELLVAGDCF